MLDWAGRPKALGGKQTGLRFSGRQWKVIRFLFFYIFAHQLLQSSEKLAVFQHTTRGQTGAKLNRWSAVFVPMIVDQLLRLFHTSQPLPLVWIKNVKLHVVAFCFCFFCWFWFLFTLLFMVWFSWVGEMKQNHWKQRSCESTDSNLWPRVSWRFLTYQNLRLEI